MPKTRSETFIECKTYGHAWFESDAVMDNYPEGTFDALHLFCDRCKSERHDFFDRVGQLIRRRYWNPDGYKNAVDERPSRAALRLMLHGNPLPRGVK